MIIGIVLIVTSLIAFYVVYNTDLEEIVTDYESFGSLKLYLGISLLFIVGLISIINTL